MDTLTLTVAHGGCQLIGSLDSPGRWLLLAAIDSSFAQLIEPLLSRCL